MKPSTTITVVLIMAVVSVTLTDASPQVEPVPVKGKCNKPHEEWTDCGPPSGCIPICNDDGTGKACAAVCVPQCVCKKGFIRESANGPCIRPCRCPSVEQPTL